jgi:general stress protein YciG
MTGKNDDDNGAGQEADSQPRRGRGFAGMDAERQRQISAEGGRAAHQKGTAHEFDSQEAREAGRKGGQASGGSRRRRSGTESGVGAPGGVTAGAANHEQDAEGEGEGEGDSREGAAHSSRARPDEHNETQG